MAMTYRDYLAFRAQELLRMEEGFLTLNRHIEEQVANPRLKRLYLQLREGMAEAIHNLERVVRLTGGEEHMREQESGVRKLFTSLGARSDEDPLAQTIRREYDDFIGQKPPRNLIDLHAAMEAAKITNLEISSYGGLVALAERLGENDIVRLLKDNRRLDIDMRAGLDREFQSILPELVGTGEGGRMAA